MHITVTLAQIAIEDGAPQANLAHMQDVIARCDPATELLVFPETTLCGFPTAETVAAVAQTMDGEHVQALRRAARDRGIAIVAGLAEHDQDRYYNTSIFIDDNGDVLMRYRKTHLYATDIGLFTQGDRFSVTTWRGIRIGLLICFDIEFPETARAIAAMDADLLIVSDGLMHPYSAVHQRAIVARSMENQFFSLLANRCGSGASGLEFCGGSCIADPYGDLYAVAGQDACLLTAGIDFTHIRASRKAFRYLHLRRPTAVAAPCSSSAASPVSESLIP